MAEWQPIETAPKDGSLIDLWGGVRFTSAAWTQEREVDSEAGPEEPFQWCYLDWHSTYDGWYWFGIDPQPSHWMPLPEPPNG